MIKDLINNIKFKIEERKSLKPINLYIITDKTDGESFNMKDVTDANIKVYAVVSTSKECAEYINTYLKDKYESHYENWCECHSLNKDETSSWNKYLIDVVSQYEEELGVYTITTSLSNIASLFRMFYGCEPRGCSYETTDEQMYYIESFIFEESDN